MEHAGYFVTNIDISSVVIDQMAGKSQQDFLVVDAIRMPFIDQAYDIVFDKGTFDALAVRTMQCETPATDSTALVTEMGRVARRAVVIITHGKPEGRVHRFMAALQTVGNWTYTHARCDLSFEAQFINIIRSKYPGRALNSVMKDKVALIECVAELARYRKEKTTLDAPLRQDCCYVYAFTREVAE